MEEITIIKQYPRASKAILILAASMFIFFLLIQLVPYGKVYTNLPIVKEPNWDSSETREIAKRACFNCHSNETEYPWYARVAPSSWLLRYDIDYDRAAFNFSDWYGGKLLVDLMAKRIYERKKPPWRYRIVHAEARLSTEEI